MLKHFHAALKLLGKNDQERAKRLGVSLRSIGRYKTDIPEPVARLMNAPELFEALAKDARNKNADPAP